MSRTPRFLIAIDIGNSAISYGVFDGQKLVASSFAYSGNIPFLSNKLIKNKMLNPNSLVIISSVVPFLTSKLEKALGKILPPRSLYTIGKNVRPRVRMRYQRKVLGSDRLVNIYGAIRFYKLPCLIIDYGTAITFDYVSSSGIFEGGLIIPGLEVSSRALQERAALLPKFTKIEPVSELVGKDTKSAMCSGLLNGFGAMTDGLVNRFRKRYGARMTVLATGGHASRIADYASSFNHVDPLHTVRSLAFIYHNEIEGEK